MEIWEPKSPGTLWATLILLRDSFAFFISQFLYTTIFSYVCNRLQTQNVTYRLSYKNELK